MFTVGPLNLLDEFRSGQSGSLGETHPFAPVASSYSPKLISHGPIFNVSDIFIGVWSRMGAGGMGATLLVNNTSARTS